MRISKILTLSAVLFLSFGLGQSFAAVKKTIAVANFENKAGLGSSYLMGNGMADMLTDSLIQSGNFIVIERQALNAVMAEQNLAASGRTTSAGTGAQMGNIKKAQILIQGAVTEFQQRKSGGGQNIGFRGINIGSKSSSAHVAIIIRLIDTTTSEVLASHRVEGSAKAGGLAFSAAFSGVNFGQSGFDSTPLGKAAQIAIDRAVAYITNQMQQVAWRGKIIKTDKGGNILVNAGENANITSGMVLQVSRPGESILDPDTGMELGAESTFLGSIQVSQVLKKYSKAKPLALQSPVEKGDLVELVKTA